MDVSLPQPSDGANRKEPVRRGIYPTSRVTRRACRKAQMRHWQLLVSVESLGSYQLSACVRCRRVYPVGGRLADRSRLQLGERVADDSIARVATTRLPAEL